MRAAWLWVMIPGAAVAYLLFEVAALQARLEQVSEQVMRLSQQVQGVDSGRATEPVRDASRPLESKGTPAAAGSVVVAAVSAEPVAEQLDALRREVAELKGRLSEEYIAELLERREARKLAHEVEVHRKAWFEGRQGGVEVFAKRAGLSSDQHSELIELMDDEGDRIIELLSNVQLRQNPTQLVTAWDEVLNATDHQVTQFLDAGQTKQWAEARAYEREVFLPFLPKKH